MTSEDRPSTSNSGPHLPNVGVRYRCAQCGNLTRFDVRVTRTTKAFHHYSVGGELQIEDVEVIAEDIESVSCRWCGSGQHVVELGAIDPSKATEAS